MGKITLRRHFALLLAISLFLSSGSVFSKDLKLSKDENQTRIIENTYNRLVISNELGGIKTIKVSIDNRVFTQLVIPGYSSTEVVGSPKLPVNRQLIELPVGAVPRVNILHSVIREINLSESGILDQIMPDQVPVPKDGSYVEFVYDEEAYAKDIFYYENPVTVDALGTLRGLRIGRLNIAPVQYNPVTHTIRVFEELEFEVVFEGADVQLTIEEKLKNNNPYFKVLGRHFLNHKAVASANRDTIAKYPIKYVIVADPMFTDQLQPFIEWKTMKGFTVVEAYTDDPGVGNTTASIKAYIEGLYNSGTAEDPAPSFVLFVGDVAQVPAWSGTSGSHVTDLYYYEFTGDVFPEIYYGRFSAQTTDQLQPQIDKTLQYEKYEMPDPSYLDEVLMVAGMDSGFGNDWANGQINYGTENYFNAAHGLTSHTYLYPASGNHSADIRQHVSDGISFGNYTAHCSASGWADPSFNTSHIPALQNVDQYCLLIGNCCSSSAFDSDACFGEAILRAEDKGALGYIGGSNSTYWDEDYYFGVGVGPITEDPPAYEETTLGVYDRTFHDHGEPFDDWYTTQDQMIFAGNLAVSEGSPGSSTYYWEIYCLMGDPSLMVYFAEPPTLTVSYDALVPLGSTTFTITTEPYAYAAVSRDGVLYGAALANDAGIAIIDLTNLTVPGEADVVLTKQNAQPYIGTVMVQNPDGPYIVMSDYEIADQTSGNGNGQADYSETVHLNVELENIGSEDAKDVAATISSESEWISITDDYELYGNIQVQTAVMQNEAYEFVVADSIPDQESVSFEISIQDSSRLTWNSSFNVILNAPVLAFGEAAVDDSQSGNGNGRLDAGENADIIIPVLNNGHSDALSATAELSSSFADITINNPIHNLGTVAALGMGYAVFNVDVAEDVPTGTSIEFSSDAHAGPYAIEDNFLLTAGQIPVLVLDFDKNNNSADVMMTCLGNLGIAGDLMTTFPDDMGLYMATFVCLGIYSNNYALSSDDGQKLADYLNNGGMLYMEGGDTWAYDDQTDVHPMFNIDGISDGTGDLGTILGSPSGFCSEMSYEYSGENNYIDHIENIGDAFLLFENLPAEYFIGVAYDAGSYKTIGVSYEFGGLDEGDNTKDELMQAYLEFFGIEGTWTGINDKNNIEKVEMMIYPNPVNSSNTKIRVTMKEQDQLSIRIYNSMGQLVDNVLESKVLPSGVHHYSLPSENLESGIYHCILNTSSQQVSNKLVIMK